jgi:hypothetical protein
MHDALDLGEDTGARCCEGQEAKEEDAHGVACAISRTGHIAPRSRVRDEAGARRVRRLPEARQFQREGIRRRGVVRASGLRLLRGWQRHYAGLQ